MKKKIKRRVFLLEMPDSQSQNKLTTEIKLLAHITRNARVESGFRIVGSRLLHAIIGTLCLSLFHSPVFLSICFILCRVSVKRWKRSKPVYSQLI